MVWKAYYTDVTHKLATAYGTEHFQELAADFHGLIVYTCTIEAVLRLQELSAWRYAQARARMGMVESDYDA